MVLQCRICGNSCSNNIVQCLEKMYNTGDAFEYFQCAVCGCLQIGEIPPDISKYYPDDYYSFEVQSNKLTLGEVIKKKLDKLYFDSVVLKSILIRIPTSGPLVSFAKLHPDKSSSILDIGCGQGRLLFRLRASGFTNLTGIEPFLDRDIVHANGIKIYRKALDDFDPKLEFHVIMLHHSLEHIPDNQSALRSVRSHLEEGGICIVRIPIIDSYAWKHYGMNWIQLDAPRHFYLHSIKSMEVLARETGFEIFKRYFDSWSLQFTGSEVYCRGEPLSSIENLGLIGKIKRGFFALSSLYLNRRGLGDQAVFYLRKKMNMS